MQQLFLTDKDASAYTEADSHAEACSLVTALPHGHHVFESTLKVESVDQPLIEEQGDCYFIYSKDCPLFQIVYWLTIFYRLNQTKLKLLWLRAAGFHSPFPAVNWLCCGCGSNGSHNSAYDARHGMQVVDSTRVLDLQVLLHEWLREM